MSGHTHFHKGSKILIIWKDSSQSVHKYHHTERGVLYFDDREPVRAKDARAFTYYKPYNK